MVLGARTEVGRDAGCGLRIEDLAVSGRHARLVWDGERWSVRDLGSTNGTRLDGRRLPPGRYYPLRVGAALSFGPGQTWILSDEGPPEALARGPADRMRRATEGLLGLPDEERPEVVLFEATPGRWIVEERGAPRPARDGERIIAGGEEWTLHLPLPYEQTHRASGQDLSAMGLRFEVSRDEEFVRLSLLRGEIREQLPTRAHHYMLLTMARARLDDLARGVVMADAGWRPAAASSFSTTAPP